ncbi:cysteine--tRNA ligase [Treponema sp.]|uniref:cysteine--tRNA ligase n=1 Tax=Treponema sp. TaxID=166 RepID=UPI0025DA9EB0|nr:cysteine--tRNA ligase [Treponema sp.]MCR5217209.1 cysteine--tRNA ligase [Treponema sp.]
MALRLYNTMGRTMQEFKPRTEGFVGFYGCGPTVYNYAHIGNLRAYVFLDTLDKTLTFLGYDIKHVMNITDVGHLTGDGDDGEDKMVKTAEERHQSVLEIAKFYTDAFMSDIDALNIRHPDVICKATEHINEMIELIKELEANGHTYMAGGNLYYDISTYPDYGKLAQLDLDELKAGAGRRKVVVVDENKRNPSDFVLWFTKSKFEDQAMTWDSPWGRGYPGWHIECSAMSMKYLGKHFDIHTGGIDHVPVHHTNEIAQAEGSFDQAERAKGPWVNFWLHNEFLVIEGGNKMSKSKGNFLRLQSLLDKGYSALDYRFFLLGAHYRKQVYFSWDAMDGAKNSRTALVSRIAKLAQTAGGEKSLEAGKTYAKGQASKTEGLSQKAVQYMEKFRAALENDLATPVALSTIQKVVKDGSLDPNEALELVRRMDSVIGLKLAESAVEALKKMEEEAKNSMPDHSGDPEAQEIDALVAERTMAKKNKDFARADEIRNILTERGITIIDTPNGPSWKRN